MLHEADPAMILAAAAELREDAIKDKTYRLTPVGRIIGRYLDELEFGNYSDKTVSERERVLANLALDYAHREPGDFSTEDLRDFLARWKDSAVNYRRTLTSTVKTFFAWAEENDYIVPNPARRLKAPRIKDDDSPRRAHPRTVVRRLAVAQEQRRDLLAVLLVYWCALRRFELRTVQVRDFDFANRVLIVHGKGGTELEQNLPEPIAGELEAYFRDIGAETDWYLLSPQKRLRFGSWPLYRYELVTLDPRKPYSLSGVDVWWQRCRARADMDDVVLHELRHTAGTHFHQESHDLVATQHFMRHRNPATTAKHYVHLDRVRAVSDVQRRMADPLRNPDS